MLPLATTPDVKNTAEEPAVDPAEAPATPDKEPEGTGKTEPESPPADPETDEKSPAAPETPKAPESPAASAPAAAPKMTAFQRGALRALGIGELIQRVEKAEGATAAAQLEVARLTTENQTLRAELATLKQETPAKIAEAAKARENAVSQAVRAELSGLGIAAETAPGQITAAAADKTMQRADFDKLDHAARNTFMRDGGKVTE
jgi:hypothetical protein